MIESISFIEHLYNSKKQVDAWPEWKKIDPIFITQKASATQEKSQHVNGSQNRYQLKKK